MAINGLQETFARIEENARIVAVGISLLDRWEDGDNKRKIGRKAIYVTNDEFDSIVEALKQSEKTQIEGRAWAARFEKSLEEARIYRENLD